MTEIIELEVARCNGGVFKIDEEQASLFGLCPVAMGKKVSDFEGTGVSRPWFRCSRLSGLL